MFASHRDACILGYYASELTAELDRRYKANGLDDAVIAYRALGKSNYDFAASAMAFARSKSPCRVMCFDITGFFDNLDHGLLKAQLRDIVGKPNLSDDWFAVLKAVTRYRHIQRSALEAEPLFADRLSGGPQTPIATMAEVKAAGITVRANPHAFGIPQGTPISAVLANLYMWSFDMAMKRACDQVGALYQRYSDDILVICPPDHELALENLLKSEIAKLKLEIKDEKTEKALFDAADPQTFQYLGFNVSPHGAVIRPGSLGRQWRKARRAIRRTEQTGLRAISEGRATIVYTKKLRRRFSPVGLRNFSSYARRAADSLDSKTILRQVRRLERMVDANIKRMRGKTP